MNAPQPLSFRCWLRRISPGFHTHASWSWRIRGVLVTHWTESDAVKIYWHGGRMTVTYPASSERAREAVMELLLNC